MADFSSWSSLLTAVRNQIANRDLAISTYRLPDGTQVEYRSLDDLIRAEAWISERAATESATSGQPSRRVYVRPQGSSW